MIGEQLGSGVRGTVIAAIQHADRSDVVVVLVKVERYSGTEYVTGLMRFDGDGLLGDEWDDGRYHRDLPRALVHLAERSGHVPYNALTWNN